MPIEIKREKVEPGSGNVFTDIGLEDAEELDTKVMLVAEINRRIAARQLSQVAAAELLMIGQPKISALRNYKLDGFSVERLMNFLVRLGCSVEIRIDARPREQLQGRISVVAR